MFGILILWGSVSSCSRGPQGHVARPAGMAVHHVCKYRADYLFKGAVRAHALRARAYRAFIPEKAPG